MKSSFLEYLLEITDNSYTGDMSRQNAERQFRADSFNNRENMRQATQMSGSLGMLHRRRAALQKQVTDLDKKIFDMTKREQKRQAQQQNNAAAASQQSYRGNRPPGNNAQSPSVPGENI